jgi:hypothetical protein
MAGSGVHAEVEVTDSVCRIVDASAHANVNSVNRTAGGTDESKTVEFTADGTLDADRVSEVFQYGDRTVYRFERDRNETPQCACEWVESHGTPARHVKADDGAVVLSFVARDLDTLRAIVTDLRAAFDGVSLRRLTRSADGERDADLVFVDRAELTDRQREVLETAHRMGYFEHPREANATDVSEALGINRSTFAEHLAAAQSKLLDTVIGD